jgi:hypothetical protein
VSTTAAIVPASPGVIAPPVSAEVTAFIEAVISLAPSIGGSTNLAVRSRQGTRMRSRHGQIVVRRPAGLPDRPFSNGRPRACPGGFGETPSVISSLSAATRTATARGGYDAN